MSAAQAPGGDPIEKFFTDYTAEWIRGNPDASTSSRYFTGQEQDRLERQLTLETGAYRRSRIKLAEKGLTELRKFDRTKMSDVQRVSANLLEWQLDMIVREEPYLDYSFPLNQFNGYNVSIVENLTVRRALATPRDAENYLAVLDRSRHACKKRLPKQSGRSRPTGFRLASSLKRLSLR